MTTQRPAASRVIAWLLSVLWVATAWAVPPLMPTQGVLRDQAGNLAADGVYAVTFALYAAPTGGDPVWVEPREVTVSAGVFETRLGEGVALVPSDFAAHPALWLEATVAGDPPLPRWPLGSSAYALHSVSADVASGLQCTGCIGLEALSSEVQVALTYTDEMAVLAADAAGFARLSDLAGYATLADLSAVDALTLGGYAPNDTGAPAGAAIPVTGADGKIPEDLLPFERGDVIAPGDRAAIAGLGAYSEEYFGIAGLGIVGGIAAHVRKGVAFGPGGELQGGLAPGLAYDAIGADSAGDPTAGGFWPQKITCSGYKGCAAGSLVQVPVKSSPLYRADGSYHDGVDMSFTPGGELTCPALSVALNGYDPNYKYLFAEPMAMGASTVGLSGSSAFETSRTAVLKSVLYGHLTRLQLGDVFAVEAKVAPRDAAVAPGDWSDLETFSTSLSAMTDCNLNTQVTTPAGSLLMIRVGGLADGPGDSIRLAFRGTGHLVEYSFYDHLANQWDHSFTTLKGQYPQAGLHVADYARSRVVDDGDLYLLVRPKLPDPGSVQFVALWTGNANPFPQPLPHDYCEDAQVLNVEAGIASATGTTDDGGGEYQAWDDYSDAACGGTGGRDVVYSLTVTERSILDVTIATDFSPVTYLRSSCAAETSLFCGADTLSAAPLDPGTYYLFVDGASLSDAGDFTVIVQRTPAPIPANDECANAEVLDIAGGPTTVSGSTSYATDTESTPFCTDAGAPDVAYQLLLTAGGKLDVSFTGEFTPAIYIKTGACASGPETWCESGSFTSPSLPPGAYFLFVDGATASDKGSFELTVDAL